MATEPYQMVKPAPIVWAHLIKPRPAHTVKAVSFKAQYEVTFLFDADPEHPDLEHPDLKAIKLLLGRMAQAEFGRVDNLKYPLESGTKLADASEKDRGFLRGKVLFKAHALVARQDGSAIMPPRLVVATPQGYVRYPEETDRPAASKFFYNGVKAIGELSFVTYTGQGGGISAYINEIMSLNAGERIAGGASDDEAKYGSIDKWSQYMGTVSQENPTAEIQF